MDGDGPSSLGRERDQTGETDDSRPAEERRSAAVRDEDEIEDGPGGGLLSRLFGFRGRPATNGELAEAIENGRGEGARRLPRARREMIERVIAFDEKRVDDVMAPRADIVAVDLDTPLDQLVRVFAEAGHSRLPIYRGDLDNPIGMVHIKDVIALLADPARAAGDGPVLKKIRRDVLYAPPSMRITDLLLKMQASRIHMALVVDEYGGTDGLVTIEDLVEEIVGDINDEHDDEEAPAIVPVPGGWEADARVELEEFAEATGLRLELDDEEADTIGGLVVSVAGRVPQRGEVLSHPAGLDFEVIDADARKVRKLRIRRTAPAKNDKPQAGGESVGPI
ncbi:hemolysin family protein [Amphiplicatus metriothermophilus]|uniref:CBS domain-containing protein n=1 Tax=Amphiplicatus metriothermophilus TaxID=1519374 RepID=A0A239PJY3_9PROT|nr:hemolysin family protein [Amphiplicatus metriothermophilus]MBB5517547.1 CBS domain containing-hemolysin-like protein [Amphiplicatus metriothermophilus]SNT68118.1 CBS domain-containing protein [Amphiplicatus metriothermophilus]